MRADDGGHEVWGALSRRGTRSPERGKPETLAQPLLLRIFFSFPFASFPVPFPPRPQRGHVMRRRAGHGQVRIQSRVPELGSGGGDALATRWHPLDPEAQDSQRPEDPGSAGGDQPEVLAADQHVGGVEQGEEGLGAVLGPLGLMAVA